MPHCSFCSKPEAEVGRLIEGPGVFMCGNCAGAAQMLIDKRIRMNIDTARRSGWWDVLEDDEMLARLPHFVSTAEQVEEHLAAWVRELRERGVTWARIGQALGMTQQSARERFSGEE